MNKVMDCSCHSLEPHQQSWMPTSFTLLHPPILLGVIFEGCKAVGVTRLQEWRHARGDKQQAQPRASGQFKNRIMHMARSEIESSSCPAGNPGGSLFPGVSALGWDCSGHLIGLPGLDSSGLETGMGQKCLHM